MLRYARRLVQPGFCFVALFAATSALCVNSEAKPKPRARPLELQPVFGYSWVNVTGFSKQRVIESYQNATPQELAAAANNPNQALAKGKVPVVGDGTSMGVAAQLKLWVMLLGVRYMYTSATSVHLHTLGADLGFRIGNPVGIYFRIGGGYTFQSGLPEGMSTRGVFVGSGLGLDVHLDPAFSIGAGLDADALFMSQGGQIRVATDLASQGGSASAAELQKLDGAAAGYQIRPQIHLTWHL